MGRTSLAINWSKNKLAWTSQEVENRTETFMIHNLFCSGTNIYKKKGILKRRSRKERRERELHLECNKNKYPPPKKRRGEHSSVISSNVNRWWWWWWRRGRGSFVVFAKLGLQPWNSRADGYIPLSHTSSPRQVLLYYHFFFNIKVSGLCCCCWFCCCCFWDRVSV